MVRIFVMLALLVSCSTQPSMKLMDGNSQYGLNAQQWDNGRSHSYTLRYVFNPNAQRVETRYIGPSENVAFAATPIYSEDGEWQTLEWRVERSSYVVLLAKWQLSASGELKVGYVRTEPLVEIRSLPLRPFSMIADHQWRPLVNGKGAGIWRN